MRRFILLLALLPLALAAQTKAPAPPPTPKVPAYFNGDLEAWVDDNVSFTPEAVDMGVSGVVEVSFIVMPDSTLTWVWPAYDPPNTFLFLQLKQALLASPKSRWRPALDAKGKPMISQLFFSFDFTRKLEESDMAEVVVASSVIAPRFDGDTSFMSSLARFGAYIDNNYAVPKELKKKDYNYRITFSFMVGGMDGKVREAKVIGCDNPAITQSVVDLITGSKWSAARINDQPSDYYIQARMFLAGDKNGKIEDVSFIEKREPEFPGGMSAFRDWASSAMNGIQVNTAIKVRFVVDRDGSLTDFSVIQASDYGAAMEAIDRIKKSPPWRPAVMYGQRVRVSYNLPLVPRNSAATK